jgi:malonyl CoA-acyl carrier protein transacylase
MFRDLACRFPQMQEALAEADALFAAEAGGQRLSDCIFPIPTFLETEKARDDTALRQTDIAQPALGAVAIGAFRILKYFEVRPDVVAGHSYGELAALCASERFDFATLCKLSRRRGKLMAGNGGESFLEGQR